MFVHLKLDKISIIYQWGNVHVEQMNYKNNFSSIFFQSILKSKILVKLWDFVFYQDKKNNVDISIL